MIITIVIFYSTRLNDPEKGYKGPRKEGLDFFVEHVVWKQLPKELFEAFGGRAAAKIRRQEILASQGKGKIIQTLKDVQNSITALVSEEIKSNGQINIITGTINKNNNENIDDKIDDNSDMKMSSQETVAKVEEMNTSKENDVKIEEIIKNNKKRSLSFSENDVEIDQKFSLEKTEDFSDAQLDLEAALEEAEFQSLLLAQNESKIIASDDVENHLIQSEIKIKLFDLMPPLAPLWEGNNPKVVYRVPAVTWTMLDSK